MSTALTALGIASKAIAASTATLALAGWTVALAALALAGRSRRQAAVREVYRSAPPASPHPTKRTWS